MLSNKKVHITIDGKEKKQLSPIIGSELFKQEYVRLKITI